MKGKVTSLLCISSVLLWVASLVSPVLRIKKGAFMGIPAAPEILVPGWQFLEASWRGVANLWHDPSDLIQVLLGAGQLSIPAGSLLVLFARARFRRTLLVLVSSEALTLLLSFGLGSSWEWIGSGFWLWFASSVAALAALLVVDDRRREGPANNRLQATAGGLRRNGPAVGRAPAAPEPER